MQIGHLTLLSPALYLAGAAILVLLLGVAAEKNLKGKLEHYLPSHYLAPALMIPAILLAGWVVYASMSLVDKSEIKSVYLFIAHGGHPQLIVDPFAAIFSLLIITATLIVMFMSIDFFGETQPHKAEFYSLVMLATVAASFAAASCDLISIYLSIEFLSLISYILAAYMKNRSKSAEAGLKYFLYGAASSAIMLYGMSILFGITGGKTELTAIASAFNGELTSTGIGWVAIVFVLVGIGFKLALVPFHFWAPDTYEGSPTPVAAFLSVVSKAAGLAVMVRFLMVVASPNNPVMLSWYWILVVLAALSMFYGNLVAIPQTNIKRMLGYSSIAQIGYIMVGVLAAMNTFANSVSANIAPSAAVRISLFNGNTPWDIQGVLIYIIAFAFMNLGAFAVVSAVGKRINSDKIESYASLMKHSPFHAIALAVFMISLAGVPPTAGFLGKFFVFGSAVKIGLMGHPELIALAIIGVVNSVISAFYYLNIIRVMFFVQNNETVEIKGSYASNAAISIALVITLALIIFAKPVANLTSKAVYAQSRVVIEQK